MFIINATSKNAIIQAEGFFPSEKRWLFYRRFMSQESKADFIGIHGGFEHGGRYEELGTVLARNGYNFYILDLTGYGRSEGKRGFVQNFDDYLIDLANFYAFLQRHKGMKVPFIFGHSMGGLLATIFTVWGKFATKGLVLSAPLFGLAKKVPLFQYLFVTLITSVYSGLYLPVPLSPQELTSDEQIIEEYGNDKYIQHEMNGRWIVETLKAIKRIHSLAPHIKVPSLIFHGEQDTVASHIESQKFFSTLGSSMKEFYLVKGAKHEVFNEKGRTTLFLKLLEWLEKNN